MPENEVRQGIFIYTSPIETGVDDWLTQHLDCDAIIDDHGETITVYAYTHEPMFNYALSQFRQEEMRNHTLLRGISSDVLSGVL